VYNMPVLLKRRQVLEEFGFVERVGPDRFLALSREGLLASEVNEGHPFLMTDLFLSQSRTQTLSCVEFLIVLSLFIGDSKRDNDSPSPDKLNVTKEVRDELWRLEHVAKQCVALEQKAGITYDARFWELSTEWIEPIADWLGASPTKPVRDWVGEMSLSEIAARHGLFEGNIQRALMKLASLVEEFTAMAILSEDVHLVGELDGASQLILRDIVVAESLYLRIK